MSSLAEHGQKDVAGILIHILPTICNTGFQGHPRLDVGRERQQKTRSPEAAGLSGSVIWRRLILHETRRP
jgi:hypothetical protein